MALKTYTNVSLIDAIKHTGKLNKFLRILELSGIDSILCCAGPFTVFAPSDDAFLKLPEDVLERLLSPENKEMLVDFIKYHLVAATLSAMDIFEYDNIQTAGKEYVDIIKKDDDVYINDAKIIVKDIYAKNGIIHELDKVLLTFD